MVLRPARHKTGISETFPQAVAMSWSELKINHSFVHAVSAVICMSVNRCMQTGH